jgi:hypothetical protein
MVGRLLANLAAAADPAYRDGCAGDRFCRPGAFAKVFGKYFRLRRAMVYNFHAG